MRRHDRAILDALEGLEPETFSGEVWRVTAEGRDPLRGSTAEGRWSPPGEFEVLYTSLERDGALHEIAYRLSLEPVWPSRVRHEIHRIRATTGRTLRFANVDALAPLGVDVRRYASFDYTATQAIAAGAQFLEFDSLIVPSARSPALHMVVFLENVLAPDALVLMESGAVDWGAWRGRESSR